MEKNDLKGRSLFLRGVEYGVGHDFFDALKGGIIFFDELKGVVIFFCNFIFVPNHVFFLIIWCEY